MASIMAEEAPAAWLDSLGRRCLAEAYGFVEARAAEYFAGHGEGELAETAIPEFLAGGKFLRPMFAYVGWRCGGPESDAALRAAASLELLHCFALAQDDVMDGSPLRRGRPALHVRFARWHTEQGWSGSADRFGESAATLSGDLFLVWSERMLRESGLDAAALARGWPRYDLMRAELAVGQLADLVNDARTLPDWETLLDVLRRKSGNYTVRRPLEFGAALAGCGPDVLAALAEYGGLVGEAFQFRDDLLGVFGDPAVTGKPAGQDLRDRKASSVVVLAAEMADRRQRAELGELLARSTVDDEAVARCRALITATGARDRLGELIRERAEKAQAVIDPAVFPRHAADSLAVLATKCTERDQ
ncbi:polyprenyl synthetase family protein [Amycolatopsis roodepoortensis]|uniref:Geranylgeranyl diphosphate synthase type I n=1 Tax=Amycolatopsis roodepoortensis TaxID=700274 RepID=A0ABR9LAV9_9PSEU|nr:polyprenyl synthetase family protein [Amycolatopsis roodepoortensis]MBE1577808.1 geranylgeranyl diphosphate synthase type I [Amycolatopsis roodepoortensis]